MLVHWIIHLFGVLIILTLSIDFLTFCWVRRVYQLAYRLNYIFRGFVVFIDLDGLKKVNDNQGHEKGDKILREMGKMVMFYFFLRGFRYGGDEFTILTFSKNYRKIVKKLEKLERSLLKKKIVFSYGIGQTENEADKAMYKMKKNRKDRRI